LVRDHIFVLSRLFRPATKVGILKELHPRRHIPGISLYADDVVLFCHPSCDDIAAVKEILLLFGRASGLLVNYGKSSAALINGTDEDTTVVTAGLGCPMTTMPMTYLGIPLTIRRPTCAQLQPLVDRIAAWLPTWKAHLMDKSGRLKLVRAVLCAIPIHQLLVYAPPKKTIKQIEKIQRGFLWAGRKEANGGNCHVNWNRVCRPIQFGGLGVQNMAKAGLALRLRWLWFSRTDTSKAWHGLDLQFSAEERALFFASTTISLGDGHSTQFWEDRWIDGRSVSEIMPRLYACIPKRRRRTTTVAQGLQNRRWVQDIHGTLGIEEIGDYLLLRRRLEHIQLSDQADTMVWKWTSNGSYSASFCYRTTFHGSLLCDAWQLTWKTWASHSVKFFHWLAHLDRCWTAERLQRRGLPHHAKCLLCDQEMETIQHLFIGCSFARQVWVDILSWLRATCRPPAQDDTLLSWWLQARQATP
jgi:hypothetical protein